MHTVLIIDPNRLIREGLAQIVRKTPARILVQGRDLADALEKLESDEKPPDLAIFNLDFSNEIDSDVSQIREARRRLPSAKILLLTENTTPAVCMRAMGAGVHALLSRDVPSDVFQKTFQLVMLGQILIPEAMGRLLAGQALADQDGCSDPAGGSAAAATVTPLRPALRALPDAPSGGAAAAPGPTRANALSERESQILECLVNGYSNKAIARKLSLAEATVKMHMKLLMRKIQASNRTQAAIWALNNAPPSSALDQAGALAPAKLPVAVGQSA